MTLGDEGTATGSAWQIGPYVLDEERFEMRRDGVPVTVQRHVLDLLLFFAKSGGKLVTKSDLVRGPWRRTSVSEAAIRRAIMLARRAIEGAGASSTIATVRGQGFRFTGEARRLAPSTPPPEATATEPAVRDREGREAAPPALAGRDVAMASLQRLWSDRERTRVALITGPAGAGKTRLVERFATSVAGDGVRVLWGRAWEGGGAPPFWPWHGVVRALLADGSLAPQGDDVRRARADVAQVLFDRAPAAPVDVEAIAYTRFRVFESIERLLRDAARAAPLLVVLEDLHHADDASILLLQFLGRAGGSMPSLLIVATCREGHPLDGAGAPALGARPLLADLFHAVSEHVALVALVALAPLSAGEPDPAQVASAVHAHLDRLPAGARALVSQAAVVGREFDVPLLAALAGVSARDALMAIQPALDAGLVEDRADRAGEHRFRSSLVHGVVYRAIERCERHRLHARVAEHLEQDGVDRDANIGSIAHHHAAALPLGDPARAVRAGVEAAEQAKRSLAYELAAEHYRRVLDLGPLAASDDAGRRRAVLTALAEVEALAGHADAALDALEEAMWLARGALDPDGFADAVLASFEWAREAAIIRPSFHGRVREALLDRPGDDARKARLLAVGAFIGHFYTAFDARLSEIEDALAMARRLEDPETVRAVLRFTHFARLHPTQTTRALALARELGERSRAARCTVGEAEAAYWEAQHALELGDGELFARALQRHAVLAAQVRHPAHAWYAGLLDTTRLFQEMRFDEAEASLRRSLASALPAVGSTAVETSLGGQLFTLGWHHAGKARRTLLAEARALGQRVLDAAPVFTTWRLAAEVIDRELAGDDAAPWQGAEILHWLSVVPEDAHLLLCLALLAHVASQARSRDRAALQVLRDRLAPYVDLHACVSALDWGPVALHLGRVTQALGDDRGARRLYEKALAASRRARSRPWQQQAARALARLPVASTASEAALSRLD